MPGRGTASLPGIGTLVTETRPSSPTTAAVDECHTIWNEELPA